MRKIKVIIILLIPILLLTGCGELKGIDGAVKKTSITDKGLKSYRCKVDIVNKEDRVSYIVVNKENKEYDVSVSTKDGDYTYSVRDDSKDRVHAPANDKVANEEVKLNYNYIGTDIFLNGLKSVNETKKTSETIGDVDYTKYSFKISKKNLNNILDNFDMKTNKDGSGYVYLDKDNYVYMINYVSGDISITVSYTRLVK